MRESFRSQTLLRESNPSLKKRLPRTPKAFGVLAMTTIARDYKAGFGN